MVIIILIKISLQDEILLFHAQYSLLGLLTCSENLLIFYFFFYWSIVDLQCFVSDVQHSDSMCIHYFVYMYIFFFRLFSHAGYYKILSIVPCAVP